MKFSLPAEYDEEGYAKEVWSDCNEGAGSNSDGYVDSSDVESELVGDSDAEDFDLGEGGDLCEGSKDSDSCDDGEGGDGGDSSEAGDSCEGSRGGDSCEGGDFAENDGVKYVPPHLRAKTMGGDKEKENDARLQKQVQGLINR